MIFCLQHRKSEVWEEKDTLKEPTNFLKLGGGLHWLLSYRQTQLTTPDQNAKIQGKVTQK